MRAQSHRIWFKIVIDAARNAPKFAFAMAGVRRYPNSMMPSNPSVRSISAAHRSASRSVRLRLRPSAYKSSSVRTVATRRSVTLHTYTPAALPRSSERASDLAWSAADSRVVVNQIHPYALSKSNELKPASAVPWNSTSGTSPRHSLICSADVLAIGGHVSKFFGSKCTWRTNSEEKGVLVEPYHGRPTRGDTNVRQRGTA